MSEPLRGNCGRTEAECIAKTKQSDLQRHVKIEMTCCLLFRAFNAAEQIQEQAKVGMPGILLKPTELVQVKKVIVIASDLYEDEIANPSRQPTKNFDPAFGFG